MGPSFLQNAIDLLDQGQATEAIRTLRPLTQRFPNYPSPFILLARAYEAEGNWKAATATWQHVNGLVAESPVVAAGMKRGRTRLAEATLRTATPALAVSPATPVPAATEPAEGSTSAPAPRAWEWPEGLINEYAELRDPDDEAAPAPSVMPESPVVKKLLARLEDNERAALPASSSLLRAVETPTDLAEELLSPNLEDDASAATAETAEPEAAADDQEAVDVVAQPESTRAPVRPTPGHAIASELLHEAAESDDPAEAPEAETSTATPSRAQELTALIDALDDDDNPVAEEAADSQTPAVPTAPPADTAPASAGVIAEPEPAAVSTDESVPDPMVELDAVFELDDASPAGAPTADDLAEGYDDLDALIESLEGARIRPRPDLDDIPPPDLNDDIEDVVSETLARIYAGQRKYEEAARVYEKLAAQQPERATEFTEKAALIRGRSR